MTDLLYVILVLCVIGLALVALAAGLRALADWLERRADARGLAAAERLERWLADRHLARLADESHAAIREAAAHTAFPRLYVTTTTERLEVAGRDTAVLPASLEDKAGAITTHYPPRLLSADERQSRQRHPAGARRDQHEAPELEERQA